MVGLWLMTWFNHDCLTCHSNLKRHMLLWNANMDDNKESCGFVDWFSSRWKGVTRVTDIGVTNIKESTDGELKISIRGHAGFIPFVFREGRHWIYIKRNFPFGWTTRAISSMLLDDHFIGKIDRFCVFRRRVFFFGLQRAVPFWDPQVLRLWSTSISLCVSSF